MSSSPGMAPNFPAGEQVLHPYSSEVLSKFSCIIVNRNLCCEPHMFSRRARNFTNFVSTIPTEPTRSSTNRLFRNIDCKLSGVTPEFLLPRNLSVCHLYYRFEEFVGASLSGVTPDSLSITAYFQSAEEIIADTENSGVPFSEVTTEQNEKHEELKRYLKNYRIEMSGDTPDFSCPAKSHSVKTERMKYGNENILVTKICNGKFRSILKPGSVPSTSSFKNFF